MKTNNKKIFLSHSSKDESIVSAFMDDILINAMGFNANDFFYTSGEGTKIKSGEDWRNSIKTSLLKAELIILFITPNYKESEICLNEMGAAWATGKYVLPLIVPPITYGNVGILMDTSQIEKLDNGKGIDRVRDIIEELFNDKIFNIRSDRWTAKKEEFSLKLQIYLEEHPFKEIVSNEHFEEINIKYKSLQKLYKKLIKKNESLNSTIEELYRVKDKKDVARIKCNINGNISEYFDELKGEFIHNMENINPVIRTIVYNNYCNKNLIVGYQDYRIEINKAIANSIINEGYDLNYDNIKIKKIIAVLEKIEKLISEKEELVKFLEEEYETEISIDNLEFWEKVLEIKMYYQ